MYMYYYMLVLAIISAVHAQDTYVRIEPFQKFRDCTAVNKIIADNYDVLAYESDGHRPGTTQSYLTNHFYGTNVLRAGQKTVGFINYRIMRDPVTCFCLNVCTYKHGLIHLMGVDRHFQSRGYGKRLLRDALQYFRHNKVNEAALLVRSDNEQARALYEKEGFRCVDNSLIECTYTLKL